MSSPALDAMRQARAAKAENRFSEARDILRQALDGLDANPGTGTAALQGRIHLELAWLCDHLEEWMDALVHADAAIEWMRQSGDHLGEARARLRAGNIAFKNGRWRTAERHFDEAQKIARQAHDVQWQAYEGQARIRWRTGQARSALRLVARGLDHANQTQDQKARALLEAAGASLRYEVGDWEAAQEGFDTAIALFRQLDEPYHLARNLNNAGEAQLEMGHVDRALTMFEESISVALASGNTRGIIYASLNRAICLAESGRIEEAEEVVNQLVPLVDASEEALVVAYHDQVVARLLLAQGRDEEALMLLQEVDRVYREQNVPFDRARNARIWARALARNGEPTKAAKKLDATEKLYRDLEADRLAQLVANERAKIA